MPLDDANFLLCCLVNSTGGMTSINWDKVCAVNGYTNKGSARNRLANLKKKYESTIGAATEGKTASVPSTPSGKKRGRKPKDVDGGEEASPSKKGKKAPASAVKVKKEVQAEEQQQGGSSE